MNVRREYETTVIVNAALEDADIEAIINKVTNYIENHGGEITAIDKWGRKRLAYSINKKYNGYYVHIVYYANSSTIPILERFLVLEDTILRHLTLVYPKKLKDYREKKAIEILKRAEESGNDEEVAPAPKEKIIEVKNKIDFDETVAPKVVLEEELVD